MWINSEYRLRYGFNWSLVMCQLLSLCSGWCSKILDTYFITGKDSSIIGCPLHLLVVDLPVGHIRTTRPPGNHDPAVLCLDGPQVLDGSGELECALLQTGQHLADDREAGVEVCAGGALVDGLAEGLTALWDPALGAAGQVVSTSHRAPQHLAHLLRAVWSKAGDLRHLHVVGTQRST